MALIPSGLKNEIRFKFAEIRNEVSRPIFVYSAPQKADCPNCITDHTGASTGIFDVSFVAPVVIFGQTISPQSFSRIRCPVCKGVGILEHEVSTPIKAIVRWNPPSEMSNGEMIATPAGLEGKNVARIKASKCYYGTIRDSTKIVVDGVVCKLHLPPVLRGVGMTDVMAIAYLVAVEVGPSVREG